jgi:hyaluronate lyase
LLANFFAAGTVDDVTVSGPASIGLGRTRTGRRLTISDPTQTQSSIRVTVRRQVVDVPVAGTFGATQTIELGN